MAGRRDADIEPEDDEPEVSPLAGLWDGLGEEAAGADWSIDRLLDAETAPTDPPPTLAPDLRAEAWRAAEAGLGPALADAAAAFARLDERLRVFGPRAPGAVDRLAQASAIDLMRREGAALAPDLLSLWLAERGGGIEEGPDLARAGWAARRLAAGASSLLGPASARRALGLKPAEGRAAEDPDLAARQAGLSEWASRVRGLRPAHPLTRAGYAEAVWRGLGLSRPGAAVEPGVIAMVLAARMGRGGAPFAPLGGPSGAWRGGEPEMRLAGWLGAITEGADAALLTLERLDAWAERAAAATADLSGRTPPRLIAELARRFAVSGQAAATAAGVSVSAATRNLMLFEERGLAREMTGRGRFRLWSARL